jgi:ATP-dependent helicase/nuclease subunit B
VRLFSINAGQNFLDTLARSLMSGEILPGFTSLADPFALARVTIYLPSLRAARALEEHFALSIGREAVLLPKIVPLGDPVEIELKSLVASSSSKLPEAIDDLSRRLILMQLIDRWRRLIEANLRKGNKGLHLLETEMFQVAASRSDAFGLAGDLASLLDEMIIDEVDWHRLKGITPSDHDLYWSLTAEFLDIAAGQWPAILASRDQIDAALRRRMLLDLESKRLDEDRPTDPVIVAGSTGSQPATARLMRAVARLPNGAVILPGLDHVTLDEEAWGQIAIEGPDMARGLTHAQSGLKRLLSRIGAGRNDVVPLGHDTPPAIARRALFATALLPAEATERWAMIPEPDAIALDGIALIEAPDERQEALAIAILTAERLHKQTGDILIVTHDRTLAAHIVAELQRFGIAAFDSAGTPLRQCAQSRLALLALDLVFEDWPAQTLRALLRHNHIALGFARDEIGRRIAALEHLLLRGQYFTSGLARLKALAEASDSIASARHAGPIRARFERQGHDLVVPLLDRLEAACAPLVLEDEQPLRVIAHAHRQCLEALWQTEAGEEPANPGEAGAHLLQIFNAIEAASDETRFDLAGYRDLFAALLQGNVVVSRQAAHARVKILGPIEARLLPTETMILCGLNETVWPPQIDGDPFLNRGMRAAIGLSPAERRIGQSAHDFTMFAGTADLVLTRARRAGADPTIASRLWQRLRAVIGKARHDALLAEGAAYLAAAAMIDRHGQLKPEKAQDPIGRPNPKPAVLLRPQSFSITELTKLVMDPYAVFADRVLGLQPLEAIGIGFDARLYGTLLHKAVADATERKDLESAEALAAAVTRSVAKGLAGQDIAPFDQLDFEGRLKAAADWFAAFEVGQRAAGFKSHVEKGARLPISLPDGSVLTISGRIDRIDQGTDGLSVFDFKSGTPPGRDRVLNGEDPQLIVSARMALDGVVQGIGKGAGLDQLGYIRLGRDPELKVIKANQDAIDLVWERLIGYLRAFSYPGFGYTSRRRTTASRFAGDFDHLARVREWLIADAGEFEE